MRNEPVGANTNLPPRNRQQRRVEQARLRAEQSQPPIEAPDREGGNSNKSQRSCNLDDDDNNLLFSRKISNAPVLNHFTLQDTQV